MDIHKSTNVMCLLIVFSLSISTSINAVAADSKKEQKRKDLIALCKQVKAGADRTDGQKSLGKCRDLVAKGIKRKELDDIK